MPTSAKQVISLIDRLLESRPPAGAGRDALVRWMLLESDSVGSALISELREETAGAGNRLLTDALRSALGRIWANITQGASPARKLHEQLRQLVNTLHDLPENKVREIKKASQEWLDSLPTAPWEDGAVSSRECRQIEQCKDNACIFRTTRDHHHCLKWEGALSWVSSSTAA